MDKLARLWAHLDKIISFNSNFSSIHNLNLISGIEVKTPNPIPFSMSENMVSNIIDELQLQNSDEYKIFTISA